MSTKPEFLYSLNHDTSNENICWDQTLLDLDLRQGEIANLLKIYQFLQPCLLKFMLDYKYNFLPPHPFCNFKAKMASKRKSHNIGCKGSVISHPRPQRGSTQPLPPIWDLRYIFSSRSSSMLWIISLSKCIHSLPSRSNLFYSLCLNAASSWDDFFPVKNFYKGKRVTQTEFRHYYCLWDSEFPGVWSLDSFDFGRKYQESLESSRFLHGVQQTLATTPPLASYRSGPEKSPSTQSQL